MAKGQANSIHSLNYAFWITGSQPESSPLFEPTWKTSQKTGVDYPVTVSALDDNTCIVYSFFTLERHCMTMKHLYEFTKECSLVRHHYTC